MKKIDIVIVNYFSSLKIEQLLQSMFQFQNTLGNLNIIIISNSNENEVFQLSIKFKSLTWIINTENLGFGKACNQALQYSKSEYVLLLNPDIVLSENAISDSYLFMTKNLDTTVLGIKHFATENKIAPSSGKFPELKNFINDITGLSKMLPKKFIGCKLKIESDSKYVDHVMGAFMMIRRKFIERFGFMDDRYFVFWEDMDFCKKVWDNGGKVYYNADISIIHEGGSSTEGVNDKKLCYSLEARLKYAYKHLGKFSWLILLMLVISLEPFSRLFFALLSKKNESIKNTFKGYLLFFKRRQWR